MDRGETHLSPEWLRAASGSSSHSDGQTNGVLSWSRSSLNSADHDHGLHLTSPSSSYKRSASSNGSAGRDNPYRSFSTRHRDRDRDRNRDRHGEIERGYLFDDGYNDYLDPIRRSREILRRSRSVVTGVQGPSASVPKRPESATSNGIGSSSGGISAFSFEKEFPSLGVEDKVVISDVDRVSATCITHGIQGVSLGLPNGCMSAFVAPSKDGSNGPQVCSALQTAANMPSVVLNTGTGLSMAEKLVQPPAPVQTTPQLPNDLERKKELEQLSKLIPLVNKAPVHNSSEKLKTKVTKSCDYNASKINMQSTSQPASRALRPPDTKPDVPKLSQPSNYQVLNWEKNGFDCTAKDGQTSRIASLEAASLRTGGQAAQNHLKSIANPKLKVNGNVGGERKPLPQSRGRIEFFNNIRKQEISRNSSAVNLEVNCVVPSSSSYSNVLVQSCEQIAGASTSHENDIPAAPASSSDCSVAKNGKNDACDEDPECLTPPNEEEAAFMRSLGWEENATEEALTPDEIKSFVIKHPALCACTKFKALIPELQQGGSS